MGESRKTGTVTGGSLLAHRVGRRLLGNPAIVDAVVRTRKIGHFFPAGTVDGYDVWLDFQARDATGRILASSGSVEDGGRGPVEKGAHFYRSLQIDGEGNPINKRNAWQTRSLLYVRLIPPGAADTAISACQCATRSSIPRDQTQLPQVRQLLHEVRLCRCGQPSGRPGLRQPSRFDSAPVPDLPIVAGEGHAKIGLGEHWQPCVRKQDRERWNDWGIGLLLQGDLKGAEYAFRRVTEAEPGYADGWLNVGRALIQEGETDAARPFVEKALALQPSLARGHFFMGMILKAAGDYDGALRELRLTEQQYPRDRVNANQIGRILFLKRRYADAVQALQKTLSVDPEDVQAHYNLMLCYRGLGQIGGARAETLPAICRRVGAGAHREAASERDNNERQPIHDHVSTLLLFTKRLHAAPLSRSISPM